MQFSDKAGFVFQLHSLNSLQMTSNNHQADHFVLSFSYQPSIQVCFVEFYLASIFFEIYDLKYLRQEEILAKSGLGTIVKELIYKEHYTSGLASSKCYKSNCYYAVQK